MALDATVGGPASDTYGTEAESLTYHLNVGNTDWGASTQTLREAALRRACIWLDGEYRTRWEGMRFNGRSQALDWPRIGAQDYEGNAIDSASIPREVKFSQFEAALVELRTPGFLSPIVALSKIVKSETVGPISRTYQTTENIADISPTLLVVERILGTLISRNEREYPAVVVV